MGLLLRVVVVVQTVDSLHQQAVQSQPFHELEVVQVVVQKNRLLLAFVRVNHLLLSFWVNNDRHIV